MKDDNIVKINDILIEDINYNFFETDDVFVMKILSNTYSKIINWSLNEKGNQHFAITINCIDINYDSSKNDPDRFFCEVENLKNYLYKNFPTTTWFFIIPERNKSGVLHFHAIISIKNFIDYNYVLKNNLINVLITSNFLNCNFISSFDIKVESLLYFKDVKNWVMYMHKDIHKWKYRGCVWFLSPYIMDFFYTWSPSLGDIYHTFFDSNSSINSGNIVNIGFLDGERFNKFNRDNNLKPPVINDNLSLNYYKTLPMVDLFCGVKITNNKIDQRTLINILQYYLILNEYYIYNDNIYVKIKESKISYKFIGTIKEILYDKFQENVVLYFVNNFEYYFKGLDFSYLVDNYFIKTRLIIESIKDISTQRIKPDFGLIEFSDGIYSIKYDRFFSNKIDYNFSDKICTIKYYNKSYSNIRKNKPDNWINGIKNALGINGFELCNEDYIRICLHIINPIHKDIFNKKSTLFIYGGSNTGKTTLIANVLSEYFGSENIGSIISSKNFKWQDLVGKILGIIDEGRYNSSMSSDLLKITGQEKIIVEKKYSKEHITIDPIPLIILTNIIFEDKNFSIDEALKNRLYIIEFINTISKDCLINSIYFKNKLKDEEANILIYCNKLLFKLKEGGLKKIGNKISNRQILKIL